MNVQVVFKTGFADPSCVVLQTGLCPCQPCLSVVCRFLKVSVFLSNCNLWVENNGRGWGKADLMLGFLGVGREELLGLPFSQHRSLALLRVSVQC